MLKRVINYEAIVFNNSKTKSDPSIKYYSSFGHVIRNEDAIISYSIDDVLIENYFVSNNKLHIIKKVHI